MVIPERELQVNQWTGIGYIVSDPATGAAGYLISGGIAGGANTLKKILSEILGIMERALVRIGCLSEPANLRQIYGAIAWIAAIIAAFSKIPILFKVAAVVIAAFAVLAIISVVLQCIDRKFAKRQYNYAFVFG